MGKSKNDNKPKLTDFHTFWKLIVLVVVALFAEGTLLIMATSDDAIEWTTTNVVSSHHPEIVVDNTVNDIAQ